MTHKLTLKQLEILVEVDKEQSISGAARRLAVTQPAVTKQMKQMEKILKQPLVEIYGRKVRLTESARNILPLAKDILRRVNGLQQAVVHQTRFFEPAIIAADNSLMYVVIHLLGLFTHQEPDSQSDLKITEPDQLISGLEKGDFDCIVTNSKNPASKAHYIRIGKFPLIAIATAQVAQRLPAKMKLIDLLSETLILGEHNTKHYRLMQNLAYSAEKPGRWLNVGNDHAAKIAVIENLGVTILPAVAVEILIEKYSLMKLNITDLKESTEYFLAYLPQRNLSHAAQKFIEFIKGHHPV